LKKESETTGDLVSKVRKMYTSKVDGYVHFEQEGIKNKKIKGYEAAKSNALRKRCTSNPAMNHRR
jgi:hypothetical protein